MSRKRVAGCELRVAGYVLRVAGCELRVAGCELRVTGCELRVAGHFSPFTDYWILDAGSGILITAYGPLVTDD